MLDTYWLHARNKGAQEGVDTDVTTVFTNLVAKVLCGKTEFNSNLQIVAVIWLHVFFSQIAGA